MPDERNNNKRTPASSPVDAPKNPLRDLSVPRARPAGGFRTTIPRFDNRGGVIPVLDHRVAPAPFAAPNSSAPVDRPDEFDEPRAAVLSPAEHARTIVGSGRTGVLATTVGDPAAPISFVMNYSCADDGSPVVCVRNSVAKLGNVVDAAKASFSVAETPLTAVHSSLVGGVTMAGSLQAIVDSDVRRYLSTHTRTHGGDEILVTREEASLFLLRPIAVLVSGRSEVARVPFAEYSSSNVDPLAVVAPGLAQHLAGDENGSLLMLARAYANQSDARSARLIGIDRLGLDLMVTTSRGSESVRLGFPNPVSTPEEVRKELNTMVRGARFKLGVG